MIEIKFTLCRIAKLLRGGAFTLVAPIALKKNFSWEMHRLPSHFTWG